MPAARSSVRLATACGPDRRTGRSDRAIRPPTCCRDSRVDRMSEMLAETRTSTSASRSALVTTDIFCAPRAVEATNTHSAPTSRIAELISSSS